MPVYQFTGVTEQDEPASGQLEAADSRAARESLISKGLRVQTLVSQEPEPALSASFPAVSLSAADSLELTKHLAELLKANVPLAPGLRALAEDLPSRRLSKAFGEIAARLEAGVPLDSAVASAVGNLPPYVRGLLAASLSSGRYQEALADFLEHERAASAMRHRLWLTLSYPLMLLAAVAIWFLFIVFVLIPPFKAIVSDFKVELPLQSVLLIRIASARMAILSVALLLVLLAAVFASFASRLPPLSRLLDWVPLIGPIWRYGALARFSNLLAVLLEQGVPLPAALDLTASGVGHADIALACRCSAKRTAQGQKLWEAISDLPQFPAVLVPLLVWGQRLSAVPEALHTAAAMFRGRVEQRAPFAAVALPAISFLVIILAIFFVVVALFMPMVKLITYFA